MDISEILDSQNHKIFCSDILEDGRKLQDIKKRLHQGIITQSAAVKTVQDIYENIISDFEYAEHLLRLDETDQDVVQQIKSDFGSRDNLLMLCEILDHNREEYKKFLDKMTSGTGEGKNFNKSQCFANIRFLLENNPSVKIGQIEKEAGLRLGYMARLEKPDNTAEPSVEFIVSAAKLLKVSLDSLILIDMTALSTTEEYIRKFLEKLLRDTRSETITWKRESADYLSQMQGQPRDYSEHVLFVPHVTGTDLYGREKYSTLFESAYYGIYVKFKGDGFNYSLSNDTTVYLLNTVGKGPKADSGAASIEVWMYNDRTGAQFLTGDHDGNPLAPLVRSIYALSREKESHPKIKKQLISAIDGYMKDDNHS